MRLNYIVWMWFQGERVIAKGTTATFFVTLTGSFSSSSMMLTT